MNRRMIATPVGELMLVANKQGLSAIHWVDAATVVPDADDTECLGARCALDTAEAELNAYFAGELKQFKTPIAAIGTPFQQRVWAALTRIPYAETRTYGEVAALLGNRGAARAVGAAAARNPIPIVVPCHRVIGHNGRLTGFAGGLPNKRVLLNLEGVCLKR